MYPLNCTNTEILMYRIYLQYTPSVRFYLHTLFWYGHTYITFRPLGKTLKMYSVQWYCTVRRDCTLVQYMKYTGLMTDILIKCLAWCCLKVYIENKAISWVFHKPGYLKYAHINQLIILGCILSDDWLVTLSVLTFFKSFKKNAYFLKTVSMPF